MGKSSFRNSFEKLNALVKMVTADKSVVKVGILGEDVGRKTGGMTNAEVGAAHEFGSFSRNIPQRSFLRKAMSHEAGRIVADVTAGSRKAMEKGDYPAVVRKLGARAVAAVRECFSSGGFGEWPQLAYSTLMARMRKGRKRSVEQRKQLVAEQLHEGAGHATILVDTGQLKRSISYRVDRRE